MKTVLWCVGTFVTTAYILFACTGCGTRIYEGGKPVFAGYGDYGKLKYRSPAGSVLELDAANHSKPTKDALDAIGRLPIGVGGGALPFAL